MSESLDLKYRPKFFNEVIGQRVAVGTLESMLAQDKLSHTIMIVGPLGTGKTTLARMIARYVNCKKSPGICSGDDLCSSCKAIDSGNSPNVIEINAAETRGINEARALIEQSKFAPLGANQRIFILDEVHALTSQAASAMLKPLEEPSPRTIWILCTTEPQKILPTIRSRSLVLKLKPVEVPILKKHLAKICKLEGRELPDNILEAIADMAQGHVRNAMKMLEGILLYTEKNGVSEGLVDNIGAVLDELLGITPEILVEKYMEYVLNGDNLALAAIRRADNLPYFTNLATQFIKNLIFNVKGLDITTSKVVNFLNKTRLTRDLEEQDLIHLYDLHLTALERLKAYDTDHLDLLDLVVLKSLAYIQSKPMAK